MGIRFGQKQFSKFPSDIALPNFLRPCELYLTKLSGIDPYENQVIIHTRWAVVGLNLYVYHSHEIIHTPLLYSYILDFLGSFISQ